MAKDDPYITVVIPTYNRNRQCYDAVKSVLDQTYRSFELIIVDDCSSNKDNHQQLQELILSDSRCIYICNDENRGVSYSRNRAIKQSNGTWIALLDSDDIWHKRKLEKQVQWIHDNPSEVIVQTKEIWVRHGVRVNAPKSHEKKEGHIFEESLERCMITPSSVLIKKDIVEQFNGFDESFPACEDYDLWLKITLNYPVGLVDEFLMTRYGGHEDQLSATIPVLDTYRIRSLLTILTQYNPSEIQRKLVIKTLLKKAAILSKGLLKRGRQDEHQYYQNIIREYSTIN